MLMPAVTRAHEDLLAQTPQQTALSGHTLTRSPHPTSMCHANKDAKTDESISKRLIRYLPRRACKRNNSVA
eukprot:160373-Amphidinium_carterae.1